MTTPATIRFEDAHGEPQAVVCRLPGAPDYGACIRYRWHTGAVYILRVASVVWDIEPGSPYSTCTLDIRATFIREEPSP